MLDIMEKGNWPVDAEVSLFHAMRGHKPVGVNRHFQMVFIHDKINASTNRKISSKEIWDHLVTMYDLQALNESEIVPFPNKEVDFILPSEDFQELFNKEYPRISSTLPEDEKTDVKSDTPKEHHNAKVKTEKMEPKQLENKHASNLIHANTPENSPKRKRTRNTPSASPATPDVPPTKRRR